MQLHEQLSRDGVYVILDVTVKDKAFTVAAATTNPGQGTLVLGALPKGNLLYLGGLSNLSFTNTDTDLIAAFNGDYSVGTVAQADTDLADAGEADLIDGTVGGTTSGVIGPASNRVAPNSVGRSTQAGKQHIINNSAGNLNVNLNVVIDAADITDGATADMTVTGTVRLAFINLG